MSVRTLCLSPAIFLVACATAQENPNYKHSTKYDPEPTQVAQTASYPYPTAQTPNPQAGTRATTTLSAPTYQSSATHPSYQGQTPQRSTASEQTYTASPYAASQRPVQTTDEYYAGQTMNGTPGYGVYQPETTPQSGSTPPNAQPRQVYQPRYVDQAQPSPVPQSAAPRAAREVPYDYSQNLVVTDMPTQSEYTRRPGGNYQVRPGDTVYSLSKRLCVEVPDISGPNQLNADYKIRIGDWLYLPASRC